MKCSSSGTRRVAAEALLNHSAVGHQRGPQIFLHCFWGFNIANITWAVAAKDLLVDDYMGIAVYPVYIRAWSVSTRNHVFLTKPGTMCDSWGNKLGTRHKSGPTSSQFRKWMPLSQDTAAFSNHLLGCSKGQACPIRKCQCSFWVCWMLLYPKILQQCAVWMGVLP